MVSDVGKIEAEMDRGGVENAQTHAWTPQTYGRVGRGSLVGVRYVYGPSQDTV